MKYILSILGVLAAIVLLGVSAAMNWRFGFTLGKTEFDAHIYGAASAAADGMKALTPFFIIWAMRQRNFIQALSGCLILVVCSFYSITSSLGFAALNRADTTGQRAIHVAIYDNAKKELDRSEEKLSWIPRHRSIGEVEADLNALLSTPIRNRKRRVVIGTVAEISQNCTTPSYSTRNSCAKVMELRKELAISKQARQLEQRITALKQKLAKITQESDGVAIVAADPQSAFLSKLLGVDIGDIQMALTILVSLLVEVGSSLGLFVAFSHFRTYQPSTPYEHEISASSSVKVSKRPIAEVKKLMLPKSDLERYYADHVAKSEGSSVTANSLYENYCKWCRKYHREAMSLPVFGRQFSELGIQKAKIGGRIRYIGISLVEVEDESVEAANEQSIAAAE
ncbi:MAG: hypothetical protein AAF228_10935 [Pseudomonadota bacterium]